MRRQMRTSVGLHTHSGGYRIDACVYNTLYFADYLAWNFPDCVGNLLLRKKVMVRICPRRTVCFVGENYFAGGKVWFYASRCCKGSENAQRYTQNNV